PTNVALRSLPVLKHMRTDTSRVRIREDFTRKLGIPNDRFVVLGANTNAGKDGFPAFMSVADRFRTDNPDRNVAFVWIAESDRKRSFSDAIARRGLGGFVYHIDEQASFEKHVCAADVILLSFSDRGQDDLTLRAIRAGLTVIGFDPPPLSQTSSRDRQTNEL